MLHVDKRFAERMDQFLDKLDAAIEKTPKVLLPEDDDGNLEANSSRLQSRKRTQPSTADEKSTSKRPRLIQHSLPQFNLHNLLEFRYSVKINYTDVDPCNYEIP